MDKIRLILTAAALTLAGGGLSPASAGGGCEGEPICTDPDPQPGDRAIARLETRVSNLEAQLAAADTPREAARLQRQIGRANAAIDCIESRQP